MHTKMHTIFNAAAILLLSYANCIIALKSIAKIDPDPFSVFYQRVHRLSIDIEVLISARKLLLISI